MNLSALRVLRGGRILLWAAVVLVYGFILAPLIFVSAISVFSNQIISFPPEGFSLQWYANIWAQPQFANGFIVSTQVALAATAAGLTIGTLASLALVRGDFPGRAAINTFLLSPLIVPGIVAGTAIFIFYTQLTLLFGWRLSASVPGLVLAHITITIPWTVRLISASLSGVDRSIEEAALNLGAPPFTTFMRITLPLIRPGIIAAALFSFIISYDNLELSLFLVGPGRTTLPIAILQYLHFNLDPTIAAVSVVQIAIIAVALLITNRFVKISSVF